MSDDFREHLYTVDARGKRKWVYPTEIIGFFKNKRKFVASILLIIYMSMPWIAINGHQAVHLDIFHRRFVFLGQTFWATDTKFLFLVLILLGTSLFFFTSLFGRVWCGWACPQTVFLEFVFRPIERLIEGNASARKKLDDASWGIKKIITKLIKYITFIIIAWMMANTFLAYFIGREALLEMMTHLPTANLQTFLISLFMMGVVLFEFGWFREQFCTVLCPYARFQSVLLDDSSLIVSYDKNRGEPRGKASENTGDCIDCKMCVKVCPTGIDIRNGLQLECIHCASCIDACNSVMVKIGKAKDLVKYSTERSLKGEKMTFLRPRTYVYGSILIGLFCTLVYFVTFRQMSEASVFHTKTKNLFTTLPSGEIINQLELHIENKNTIPHEYTAKVIDNNLVQIVLPVNPYVVQPNKFQNILFYSKFNKNILKNGKLPIQIEVSDNFGFRKILKLELLGPG